ncbi:onanonoxo-7-onima-8-eninoihtemlysoneda [Rickenella mellea]|uniref:Onanonoxo-7-onima-8-eninoihtemlysoneda n=1 Tax=Rickenella mellea TaxID=50990 RepID=A0A4Y7PGN5_9AGAM|nr:onanonoxo-7-onima-8-eninoihtemlysoneda [Rickenella mellea]
MAHLYKNRRIHQIFGANTDVGKTVITTALVRASASAKGRVFYLKPVSTGPRAGADDIYVKRFSNNFSDRVDTHCAYSFSEPLSPHLAAKIDGERHSTKIPTNDVLIESISAYLRNSGTSDDRKADIYVETAGGVHSPTMTGTLQADCYRPLLLPTILIGDAKLGGISATISSYESLLLRGYSVDSILLFRDEQYRNYEFLTGYFSERGIHVGTFTAPPHIVADVDENTQRTEVYYRTVEDVAMDTIIRLDDLHAKRIAELDSMPRRTLESVWWPFVQHGLVKGEQDVTVIDSAFGDFFSIYDKHTAETTRNLSFLRPQLDSSASWWTQTFGHAHPALTLAAARAAGRYGHVMFPQATHLPALRLAERLLAGPGSGWASRVFFSDDGSTAMEVALKMALRAYTVRHGDELVESDKRQLGVLGLKGSYHGDTIGAMDACDAGDGVYTCEWHDSKGYWFDPPSVGVQNGLSVISIPQAIVDSAGLGDSRVVGDSLSWIYDIPRRLRTPLASQYREYIERSLQKLQNNGFPRLAALVLEPLVMGSGGMIFVDPLFQRVLIDVVRSSTETSTSTENTSWRGLPVIFDEVFAGLYRLGIQSSAPLLGTTPDIAVYAKTLTGGLVPLAATLASQSVFDAFHSESKADALLHGHSYTAHAVGCEVANEALDMMGTIASSETWETMRDRWRGAVANPSMKGDLNSKTNMWSFWDPEFIKKVSQLDMVNEVMTLGTVLAIKLRDTQGGYRSHSAQTVLASIAKPDVAGNFGMHFRTLGNVAYFMTSLNTTPSTVRTVEARIMEALKR